MDNNQSISISQCANGFIVMKAMPKGEAVQSTEPFVFQSMQELLQFVRKHFDYRNCNIKTDADIVK